ncbi:MAG: hypothetical protein ACKOWI_01390 [Rhodoluna sp.]
MRKKVFLGVVLSAVFGFGLAVPPASASEQDKIVQIVEKLAPEVLGQTVDNSTLNFSEAKDAAKSTVVNLLSTSSDKKSTIALAVDYMRSVNRSAGGLTLMSGQDPAVFALVQSGDNGFRILTVLTSRPQSNKFSYDFDVPKGTEILETPSNYLLAFGDKVLGSIQKPWAVDANGRRLATHFDWDGRTLTQVLDENLSNVSYPALMDPAWGYTKQYALVDSPEVNFAKLQLCFNCYFPVPGAPYAYPRIGQLLPLTVAGQSFECTMGPTYQFPGYREFQFNATKNHVDKLGSSISFQMTKIGSGYALVVQGYVVNDFGGPIARWGYLQSAGLMWQSFANNLNFTRFYS